MPICMREGCTEVAANRARRFVALPLQGPLSQVLRHCQLQRGEHVAPRMDVIPCGPYPEVTQSDYAVSMHTVGHEQVLRVLAGVGTRLLWNADDQNFIGRVGQSIRALICHARALRLQMARRCSALPEPVKSSLEVAKKQMEQLLGSIDHLLCAARPDKEPSSGPAAAPSDDPAVIPDFEHHQLERIFQSSPAAMALFRGPSLIFEKINRPYQEIFFARNLLGKPFLDALPEFRDQPFFGLLYRVFETGETFVGQEMLARLRPTPDGPLEDRYYDFTYVRIDTPRGEPYGVYVHATDVSQRVLWRRTSEGNQQRLEAAVLELTAERQMHETFVATLTHDLRTPLAAAQMSLQLLLRSSELSDKSMRYVQRAKDSVDRADEMISDLLDVSQIRAGEHLSLQMDPCELVSLTQRTLDGLANLHGPRFALQAPSRVAGYWNSSAIQRIIENLCSNAVKYGDPVATVAVHLAVEDENVSIAVHNEGPAIPMHERAHLFTPFRRARKARASGKSGWGLGLTLVRGLALAHGGTIDFRSEVDRGTTFCIRLPVDARPFQDIDANNATER